MDINCNGNFEAPILKKIFNDQKDVLCSASCGVRMGILMRRILIKKIMLVFCSCYIFISCTTSYAPFISSSYLKKITSLPSLLIMMDEGKTDAKIIKAIAEYDKKKISVYSGLAQKSK
jgi:hypothetical protein